MTAYLLPTIDKPILGITHLFDAGDHLIDVASGEQKGEEAQRKNGELFHTAIPPMCD